MKIGAAENFPIYGIFSFHPSFNSKSYAISLEGFDFGDEFLQIASPTHLLTFQHASSVSASKLTIGDESSHYIVYTIYMYVQRKVGDAAEKLKALPKHYSEKESG